MDFISSDFRRIARDKLRGNWGMALLATLVAGLLGGSNGGTELHFNYNMAFDSQRETLREFFSGFAPSLLNTISAYAGIILAISMAYMVVALIVGSCVALGHNLYYIDLCNNRGANFSTLVSRFSILGKAIGQRLYTMLFVMLWSLLLIIPGVVAAYRYAMAPYLLAQHPEMGAIEAVQESKRLMNGHKWRLFCLDFSFIGWALLCVLTLGIGNLWLNPYRAAARAAFYLDRTGQGIPLN